MTCPRCGFPISSEPCKLCGLVEFDSYELARFSNATQRRFEFTFIVLQKHFALSEAIKTIDGVKSATTDEILPRTFIFFPDNCTGTLFKFLQQITTMSDWSVLINGRTRPFSLELWLPLLELTELI